MAALEQEPSIASVTTQFDAGVPQRRLQVDREQALIAGVDLTALYGNLSTLLGGRYIDNFTRFGRLYQTYLQAAPAYRADERSLERYYVRTASGESVPISTLVEVVDTVGTAYVSQFDLYRSISLTITPKSDASTATVMGRTQAVANEVLSDGAVMAWSGLSYQEAKASSRAARFAALAVASALARAASRVARLAALSAAIAASSAVASAASAAFAVA